MAEAVERRLPRRDTCPWKREPAWARVFAYLVPAILVVTAEHDESSITERTRKPLVVSSHTIGLHETPASVRGFDVGVDCGEVENAKRRRCGIQSKSAAVIQPDSQMQWLGPAFRALSKPCGNVFQHLSPGRRDGLVWIRGQEHKNEERIAVL